MNKHLAKADFRLARLGGLILSGLAAYIHIQYVHAGNVDANASKRMLVVVSFVLLVYELCRLLTKPRSA